MKSNVLSPSLGSITMLQTSTTSQRKSALIGAKNNQRLNITKQDLNKLIPVLQNLILCNDPEIGGEYYESGYRVENDYAQNSISYEQDGWEIYVEYECCGEWYDHPGDRWTPSEHTLRKAWGEITSIDATYTDENTGEYIDFSESDLSEIWDALEESLAESLNECLYK